MVMNWQLTDAHHIFSRSCAERPSGCFQFLACAHNTAISSLVHMLFPSGVFISVD